MVAKVKRWPQSLLAAASGLPRAWRWLRKSGLFYVASAVVHVIVVASVLSWTLSKPKETAKAEECRIDTEIEEQVPYFEVSFAPLLASELSSRTLGMGKAPEQQAQHFDSAKVYEEAGGGTKTEAIEPAFGGLGGFETSARNPNGVKSAGAGGVGIGLGISQRAGSGGSLVGLNGAGHGARPHIVGPSDPEHTERAVAAALNWFYRHQNPTGGWSLTGFVHRCTGTACVGAGNLDADGAATALALLSLMSADQTQARPGPYQRAVARGLEWLLARQSPEGDLGAQSEQVMHSHALATLALCENYALTRDERIGQAAQRGVRFIEATQDATTGAWPYRPGDLGDSETTPWQVMALRSAQNAGLEVNRLALQRAFDWFNTLAANQRSGASDLAVGPRAVSVTATGMLSRQCLGLQRVDPASIGAHDYLVANLPLEPFVQAPYTSFVLTATLHNHGSNRWEMWNEYIRRSLIETQIKEGCAAGSWHSDRSIEPWIPQGGRLVTTSFATLSLAMEYGHLPMHHLDKPSVAQQPRTQMR